MTTKSELMLSRLIEERLTPGADVAEVDRRIRALFEEEWCVVFTDMAGLSRHSAEHGIVPLLCLIHELKRIARPVFEAHGGFVLKTIAGSFLVVFRRAPDALDALVELQRLLVQYNQNREPVQHIEVGAGIGYGRVLKIGDEDVYGVEVNYAAKLGEEVAQPGEILVTDSARAALMHLPGVAYEPLDRGLNFSAFKALHQPSGGRDQ